MASQVRRFRDVIRSPKPGHWLSQYVTAFSAGGFSFSTAAWVSLMVGIGR
jgi:hypothetical protein